MDELKSKELGLQGQAGGVSSRKKHPWEPPRVTGAALNIRDTSKPYHASSDVYFDSNHEVEGPS